MSDESSNTQKKLRLGIEAARAGQKNIAQVHLTAVLQSDPQNIPAMLWLAFVLPSPRESVHWLERALDLDPNNERAQSGLRWAKGRLGLEPVETGTDNTRQPLAETQTQTDPPAEEEPLRKKILSDETQKKAAKKGALAHRARRRTIDPLTTLLIIFGTLTSMALGLSALVFVPADTLAAWLPVSTPAPVPSSPGETSPTIVEVPPSAVETSAPRVNHFVSDGDTLIIEVPQVVEAETVEPDSSALPTELAVEEPSTETTTPLPLTETNPASIEPPTLIDPEVTSTEPEIPQAVGNLLLAHQPAYPGEKWIEVNVTTQQITAWEGDVPVFTFTGSTGLLYTPTVLGEFHIYWKLESTLMTGPGYYLPDVPYTMYFYKGYALHGTYWHDNFGQPMSRGCVNLETGDAKKLFEWAGPAIPSGQTQVTATTNNPGTLVVVHE